MNIRPVSLACLLAVCTGFSNLWAEPEVHVPPTSNPTFPELPAALPLWPRGAPGSEGDSSPLQTAWENYSTTWYPVIAHVSVPAILPFLPAAGKATGVAIVVCPGGGHRFLAMEHEGYAVGTWLAAHGIAAFVLEYRLAHTPNSPYRVEVHALMDAQRAIRTVRSRASEWKVDPSKVGIIGFSAGGEVAALAATRFVAPVSGSTDAVDALDCRPDFQGLFYPGLPDVLPSPDLGTPPAFLCGAHPDRLMARMEEYSQKLNAAGVSTELHIYSQGGHGFGIREEPKAVYSWMGLFENWVTSLNLTSKSSEAKR